MRRLAALILLTLSLSAQAQPAPQSVQACMAQIKASMARQGVNLDFIPQADRNLMTAHCQCRNEQQRAGQTEAAPETSCSAQAAQMGPVAYSAHFLGRYRSGQ